MAIYSENKEFTSQSVSSCWGD